MHETIRIAKRPLVCDACGMMIHKGERFRVVRDEYTTIPYHEHIQCPGAAAVVTPRRCPTPVKPKAYSTSLCFA